MSELSDKAEIEDLLAATESGDLRLAFERLGRLDPNVASLDASDIVEVIHLGKRWWARHEAALQKAICSSALLQDAAGKQKGEVALAIAAAIGVAVGHKEALVAAVIVVRLGLQSWCECYWQKDTNAGT